MINPMDRARLKVAELSKAKGLDDAQNLLVTERLIARLGVDDFVTVYDSDSILQRRVRASRYVEISK